MGSRRSFSTLYTANRDFVTRTTRHHHLIGGSSSPAVVIFDGSGPTPTAPSAHCHGGQITACSSFDTAGEGHYCCVRYQYNYCRAINPTHMVDQPTYCMGYSSYVRPVHSSVRPPYILSSKRCHGKLTLYCFHWHRDRRRRWRWVDAP